MTATPSCEPWCDNHQFDELSECYRRVCIYDDGSAREEKVPAPVQSHPRFDPPKEINRVFLTVMKDEEDESPRAELAFFENGNFTDPDCLLLLDSAGLKDIHAQLDAVLNDIR